MISWHQLSDRDLYLQLHLFSYWSRIISTTPIAREIYQPCGDFFSGGSDLIQYVNKFWV